MRHWFPLLLLLLSACGPAADPPLEEGELAVVAARAAAYRAGETFAAAEYPWEYARPWERRRVVLAEIVSGYADRGEEPPPALARAFFVSMSLARPEAPPLRPEQGAFAVRLEEQTRDLFAGETHPVADSVSTDMEGIPVEYISRRGIRIQLTEPSPGERVASPLRVEGNAPGSWLFEGAARARVVADDGTQLGAGVVRALAGSMAAERVSFAGEIPFAAPDSGLAWLHVEAANPSGESERADHVEVPVRLSPSSP